MRLYHGTYLDKLVKIINDGKLDNTKADNSTVEFDEIFKNCLGKNITENAIYLTDDISYTRAGYDFEFEIDTDSNFIDTNKLFVANFDKREQIMCAETNEEMVKLAKEYEDSFIPFKDYINNLEVYNKKHWFREFLYFSTIDISSYISENKSYIIGIFEEDWAYPEDYKNLIRGIL